MIPRGTRVSVAMVSEMRPHPTIALDNRIIVGDWGCKVIGLLASKLFSLKRWPSEHDIHYDEMLKGRPDSTCLVYTVDGKLKRVYKSYAKALKTVDFDTDVLVYYSPDGDTGNFVVNVTVKP